MPGVTAACRAGLASQTAATSVSGQAVKFRIRFGPQYPYPIMPTRRRSIATSRNRSELRGVQMMSAKSSSTLRKYAIDTRGDDNDGSS